MVEMKRGPANRAPLRVRPAIGLLAMTAITACFWTGSTMASARHSLPALQGAVPAQPQGAGREPPFFAGMLAAHNRARRAVGVPDLQWSTRLSEIAQEWAGHLGREGCRMHHSGVAGLGENLAWAAGQRLSPAQVVAMWVDEARAFDPRDNECDAGAVCGHYTQVVWRNTKFVGCGMVGCGESEVWVCNYSPPGNYVGERPY
jgi:uncharacterized protein YkwD